MKSFFGTHLRLTPRNAAPGRCATMNGWPTRPLQSSPDPGDVGSRIDPVLARSWLLVNGAQYDRFAPAAAVPRRHRRPRYRGRGRPEGQVSARDNVIRWLSEGNSDWVRVNGFGTPWWADDLDALGKYVARRGDAGDGRIGRPRHRNRQAAAERADRRAGRDGPRPGAHHRDRRDQGHVPAGVRHRRLPPRHRLRRQPDHPGLRALAVHDRRQGGAPAQRDRRADRRLQRADAQRGDGGLRRIRHDRQDLPDTRSVPDGERGTVPVAGRNQLGPKSFSSSSNATAARSATARTCHASPGPTRSSTWPAPTASRCRSSTTSTTRRTSPRRRTPTTTEVRRSSRFCAGMSLTARADAAARVDAGDHRQDDHHDEHHQPVGPAVADVPPDDREEDGADEHHDVAPIAL